MEIRYMIKKYIPLITILLFVFFIFSIWKFPAATPVLGILLLLAGLAISIFAIFEKHKGSGNPRVKIARDVSILVITLLLIILFGGLAALFANYYVTLHFGTMIGFLAAIAASFLVGYLIRKGMGRFSS